MVVRQAVGAAFGSDGSNELSFEVNRFDCGFYEAGPLNCGADGLRAMSQLQPAAACLEQERCEQALPVESNCLGATGYGSSVNNQ